MAKDTPSMAKNKIKRCLWAIYDQHPKKSEVDSLWTYFESKCAYCGVEIERSSRTGHVDHLIPSAEGGSNSIHNHVLACARCNGDEKREEDWLTFLSKKSGKSSIFEQRRSNIEEWLSLMPPNGTNTALKSEVEKVVDKALKDFDSAVAQVRSLINVNDRG
ncbi:HNH endonuclease [Alteromonas marina]|nr:MULTISPECIES: HNH endonuclease signature motif containing protein [Alteromonas]GFD74088.1 hypothetical protein KUL113_35080 [Tenacibaculum sp. KUL113]GFD84441.1 hypothetical protein KUL150_05000 [Alteromonas sp. KUL150]